MAIGAGALLAVAGVIGGVDYVRYRDELRAAAVERQQARDRQAAAIERHRQEAVNRPATVGAPIERTLDPVRAPYWTSFRGPKRDGEYREQPILTNWPSSGLQPLWKQPVGGGHGSFAMAGGRAFTIEQRGAEEVVAAYDVATGREVWKNGWKAAFSEHYGGDGPRATPVWHDGTVFALGANGELRALDAGDGRVRWRTNILEDAGASNLEYGMSASPLVVGDTVIVLPGGSNGRSVVAYHRASGQRVWSALDDRASYASPMVVTLAGVEQILVFSATRLVGLSLDGAHVLWGFDWETRGGINPSQPMVLAGDRIFLSTGYGMGAVMIALSRDGGAFTVKELWRTNRMKNQFTTSVFHDGYIYGLDEAILACLDATTGELKWKGGRYGYGQVMLASGHLVVVTETGELALVRATPERHTELARFAVLEGRTWNHPAIADGILLIRNGSEMAAFDLRGGR